MELTTLLPANEDVRQPTTVTVSIQGADREAPPKAAAFVKKHLKGQAVIKRLADSYESGGEE
jgi:hypothetical protein